jgi:hypothetical protein
VRRRNSTLDAIRDAGAAVLKFVTSGQEEAEDEWWTIAARRLGGRAEIDRPSFFSFMPIARRIHFTADDVPILVHSRYDRKNADIRVVAQPLVGASTTRIACAPRDLFRKATRKLGIGELATGDSAFDADFHLSADPEALALFLLDEPTRRHVKTSGCAFELESGGIVVVREGRVPSVEFLTGGAQLVEGLVHRWKMALRGPERIAETLGLTMHGPVDLRKGARMVAEGQRHSENVRLSIRIEDANVLTVVSIDDPSREEWTMERDADDAFTNVGAPPERIQTFAAATPDSLRGCRAIAGEIELAFDGLTPAPKEVATSLDALLEATAAIAPYR